MNKDSWAGIIYNDLAEAQKKFLLEIVQNNDRNYFLKGCAGSGKTVIAAHAVRMIREQQKKSIKLLVYTKLLSKFISDGFRDIGSKIDNVDHFHSWRPQFNEIVDIIIVDECQDFQLEWRNEKILF